MESGEAALGVAKPLMASNDTLFNLEDTFGDDPFSPRASSQNDLNILSPIPPMLNAEKPKDIETSENSEEQHQTLQNDRPKMELNLDSTKKFRSFELLTDDAEMCSPDQAKTFSEDINLTEPQSSDLSVTADQDGTFTTIEEKTCITVDGDNTYVKDEEIISQISEPDWELTVSSTQKHLDENNSLVGIDSLEVIQSEETIVENKIIANESTTEKADDEKYKTEEDSTNEDESEKLDIVEVKSESDEKCFDFLMTSQKEVDKDKDEGISSKEESGNETENSINDENDENSKCNPLNTTKTNQNYKDDSSNKENSQGNNKNSNLFVSNASSQPSQILVNSNILDFLNKEIEHASSQFYYGTNRDLNTQQPDSGNSDSGADMATDFNSNENIQLEQTEPIIFNTSNRSSFIYKVPNTNTNKIVVEGNTQYLIEYNGKGLLTNGNSGSKFVSRYL